MRTTVADGYWVELEGTLEDRAPGAPLLGFLSGTLVSLGLWALISWFAFSLLV